MTLTIPKEVIEEWNRALWEKRDEAIAGGQKAIDLTGRELEANVSKRVADEASNTGQYLDSIFHHRGYLRADVGATAAHAPYVEYGTFPHWPPFKPIREWVWLKRKDFGITPKEVDSVAWAVCRKIATKGTEPGMQWHDEIETIGPKFIKRLQTEIEKLWKT